MANKVGTYPLAVLAARHGVPFYVAAPLSTIDPATPDGAAIPIEERDPAELVGGRRRVQPRLRRDARRARDGDRDRGGRARAALRGVDRAGARGVTADLRSAVVEAAREMLRLGLVVGHAGNVSARDGDSVLITPASTSYERMAEDDLVAIALDGEPADGAARAVERVARARRDLRGAARRAARSSTRTACMPPRGASPASRSTPAPRSSRRRRAGRCSRRRSRRRHARRSRAAAAEALGDRRAVLLGRHGAVGIGATPAEALATCVAVERQAQIAWLIRR